MAGTSVERAARAHGAARRAQRRAEWRNVINSVPNQRTTIPNTMPAVTVTTGRD